MKNLYEVRSTTTVWTQNLHSGFKHAFYANTFTVLTIRSCRRLHPFVNVTINEVGGFVIWRNDVAEKL
jgi:hypothetical protein